LQAEEDIRFDIETYPPPRWRAPRHLRHLPPRRLPFAPPGAIPRPNPKSVWIAPRPSGRDRAADPCPDTDETDKEAQDVTTTRGGIVGWILSIPQFFSEVRSETRKVVWPDRKQTVMTAVMVLVMTTILAIFFLGVDSVFEAIVKLLLSLAK